MRHRRNTQNLSRFSSYFQATIRSLTHAVLLHQSIVTTKVRAKLARRSVEKMITLGKDIKSLAARRRAFSFLSDHDLVKKLFSEIAPMFSEMNGGYTRIIPYKRRRGDNAELVVLELSKQTKVARPVHEKKSVKKVEEETPKTPPQEKKIEEPKKKEPGKPHTQEIAPPEKEKHKKEKETKKPSKQILGGFGKFFKPEQDSK